MENQTFREDRQQITNAFSLEVNVANAHAADLKAVKKKISPLD